MKYIANYKISLICFLSFLLLFLAPIFASAYYDGFGGYYYNNYDSYKSNSVYSNSYNRYYQPTTYQHNYNGQNYNYYGTHYTYNNYNRNYGNGYYRSYNNYGNYNNAPSWWPLEYGTSIYSNGVCDFC